MSVWLALAFGIPTLVILWVIFWPAPRYGDRSVEDIRQRLEAERTAAEGDARERRSRRA